MKRLLLGLAASALAGLATAPRASGSPPFLGEAIRWDITYAGMTAGSAWVGARAEGAAVILEGGARNADWYASLYSLDDHVRSTWLPDHGSVRYETRFREGDFHQDQDMHIGASGTSVLRHQEIDGVWKTWTDTYGPTGEVQDSVSAMYALRLATGAGPWTWKVFSGRKTWTLLATPRTAEPIDTVFGPIPTDPIALSMAYKGELEQRGRFVVYLTEDAARVPVRAEILSNVGTIRADLVGYRSPEGRVWGTLDPP